jgi:outer membrane protein
MSREFKNLKLNKMKKLALLLLFIGIQFGFAQNVAYIESSKILDKMPEYKEATDELEAQVNKWESELDVKFESIESMYNDYVKTERMMSEEIKKQKQEAIFEAERLANEYKESKFGQDGELFTLQESKLKPSYDKINAASEQVAMENGYDYVFDKSIESNWIYTNPKLDLTEKVLANLKL